MTESGRNARVIARFAELMTNSLLSQLNEVLTEDCIQEIPQSGERIRGIDNFRATLSAYPGREKGGLTTEPLKVLGEEPHYVMSPTFNVVRVEGSGDHPMAILKSKYPDGSTWWVIVLITMRGDKMARQVTYFAPAFPPPEWRAEWVELMGGEGGG